MNIDEAKKAAKRTSQIFVFAAMAFVLPTSCAQEPQSATETLIAAKTGPVTTEIEVDLTATPAAVVVDQNRERMPVDGVEGIEGEYSPEVAVVSDELREELGGENWEVMDPVQHEDGTWLLYRQHSITNKKEMMMLWNAESGEWTDHIKRLESPNGRVFWDIHASWYEHVGTANEITKWEWNPDIPEAAARWEEAAYRALWSLATGMQPNITLDEVMNGTTFLYKNNQGEVVEVDTRKPVRFVWTINLQSWSGYNYTGASPQKFWLQNKESGSFDVLLGVGSEMWKDAYLADGNWMYVLRGLSIPDFMNGGITSLEGFYKYYIRDNPNITNYVRIEELLFGESYPNEGPNEKMGPVDGEDLLNVIRGG